MSRFFKRSVFVLSTAIFAGLGLGFGAGQAGLFGVHAEQDGAYRQMHVYAEVLKRIQSDYVTEPNINDVTAGALHGLLEALDADSSYLTAPEYKIYKERPSTGLAQIGITVSKRFGYAVVVNVIPGSPAEHEHLAEGDVIESIGDQSTREMSLAVIRMMLEGKPGSNVTLSVVRPRKPDPDKITVSRAITAAPSLREEEYANASILYLKPGTLTTQRVDEIAQRLKTQGKSRKVVLDLRNCSGGDSADGIRVANFFINRGTLATLEGQRFPAQTFTADPARYLTGAPVAVLVNRGTYGAAELVAAAIAGAKRGDVVGERTFGEGAVQRTIELPDGAALFLTVAKFQGPDGKKIQDEAVAPTVQVGQPNEEEFEDGGMPANGKGDEPLNKALDLLKAKSS